MCGIAGFVDYDSDVLKDGLTLHKMTRVISHRGPDVSGSWVSHDAALGHRRLIVVDPFGGSQPMTISIAGNSYTIVYNGEIYNTQELRKQLIDLGHSFNSHSDTEVLLISYIEWGANSLEKLNGIFAFAIWEEKQKKIFLARDRMGVKPLFYSIKNGCLIFASEIKSILQHKYVSNDVDSEGLCEVFGLAPARREEKTAFKDIMSLRPAECMMFSRIGVYIAKYWQFESKEHTDSLNQTCDKLKYLIEDSVERQMVADVPVCTFLSGGLDSSTLSSLAARKYRLKNKQLKTFSIDYKDNERYFKSSMYQPNSDSEYIDVMSSYINSKHTNVVLDTNQLIYSLEESLYVRDLPGMADVDSSLLVFCRKVKQQCTVSLSGECADELFGGYPWFTNPDLQKLDIFPWANSLVLRRKIMSRSLDSINMEDYAKQAYLDTINETPLLYNESKQNVRIRKMFYLNIKWFMTNLLERKDRMSMASGLEVRVPFCDHRIAEYAWNIPYSMKTVGNMEKGILRMAVKDFLPDEIYNRKKSPYPKTHNPQYLQGVSDILRSILDDKNSRLHEIIDSKFAYEILDDSYKLETPWFGQLMRKPQLIAFLIQLEFWLLKYNVNIIV